MLLVCVAIAACLEPSSDFEALEPEPVPVNVIGRGGMGSIMAAELETMRGLAWPQTYDDMVGTFGYASRSTHNTDVYRVEGTAQEVWVLYNGKTANGFVTK